MQHQQLQQQQMLLYQQQQMQLLQQQQHQQHQQHGLAGGAVGGGSGFAAPGLALVPAAGALPTLLPQQPSSLMQPGYGSPSAGARAASFSGPSGTAGAQQLHAPQGRRNLASMVRLDFIKPNDLGNFESTFLSCAPSPSGQVSAMAARNVFLKSQLPEDVLARVWELASVARQPTLSFPEFAVAMFLIRLRMSGQELPPTLPDNVRSQIQSSMAAVAMGLQQPAVATPPSVAANLLGGLGMTPSASAPGYQQSSLGGFSSPLQPQSADASLRPSPSVMTRAPSTSFGLGTPTSSGSPGMERSSSAAATSGWAISSQEKAGYDAIFKVWDPNNTGFLDGDRARRLFVQSGLPDNILAQVWNLADIQGSGKLNPYEFAVAMHLLHRKKAGNDLPTKLPANLVPPSSRDLDSMANLMKSQVMNDIVKSKQRQLEGGSRLGSQSSLADDPLFGGFGSGRPSLSKPPKEIEEAERARITDAIEDRRKDIASLTHRLEASKQAVKDIQREVDRRRRSAEQVLEDIVFEERSKSGLIDRVRSTFGSSSGGSSANANAELEKRKATASILERDAASLEQEIAAVAEECRTLSRMVADKKSDKAQENSRKNQSSGGDDIASRAAALLAARMAALGVSAPSSMALPSVSSSSFSSPAVGSSNLSADLDKIQSEKSTRDNEIDSALSRTRLLSAQVRASVQRATLPVAVTGSDAVARVLASLKGWEPSLDDRLRYEDGVGIKSKEVRDLIESFKRRLSGGTAGTGAVTGTTGGHQARVEAALQPTALLPDSFSVGAFASGGGAQTDASAKFPDLDALNGPTPFGSFSVTANTFSAPSASDPFSFGSTASGANKPNSGASPAPTPFGNWTDPSQPSQQQDFDRVPFGRPWQTTVEVARTDARAEPLLTAATPSAAVSVTATEPSSRVASLSSDIDFGVSRESGTTSSTLSSTKAMVLDAVAAAQASIRAAKERAAGYNKAAASPVVSTPSLGSPVPGPTPTVTERKDEALPPSNPFGTIKPVTPAVVSGGPTGVSSLNPFAKSPPATTTSLPEPTTATNPFAAFGASGTSARAPPSSAAAVKPQLQHSGDDDFSKAIQKIRAQEAQAGYSVGASGELTKEAKISSAPTQSALDSVCELRLGAKAALDPDVTAGARSAMEQIRALLRRRLIVRQTCREKVDPSRRLRKVSIRLARGPPLLLTAMGKLHPLHRPQ
ncbi:hypothetical protein DFJ73DRAFT_86845 [Zopfochytrium polystomum]|nr:hypothetical protein DFJ73DRAFT_86845 [Zopfochytrium polystomum]